jgi:hypothetical protein
MAGRLLSWISTDLALKLKSFAPCMKCDISPLLMWLPGWKSARMALLALILLDLGGD